MTQHRELQENIWRLLSVSGSNTITARARPTFSIYKDGQIISWTQATSNTGAVTININGLGAKAVTKVGSTALATDDLVSGREYIAVYDGTRFQLITGSGGGVGAGSVVHAGARWIADGTKVAGSGIASVTRTAIGKYRNVIDGTAATVGGYIQMWPVPGVSGVSGAGGDGVSPFKAFDSHQVVQTDTTANIQFEYNDTNDKFYAWGANNDDAYIHTNTTWTTAPVQVDASAKPVRPSAVSGCLSREGLYMWFSADTTSVRVMNTATNTMTDFGGTVDWRIIAATDDCNALIGSGPSGPRIWVYHSGNTYAYDPNIGTATMGAATLTYGFDSVANSFPGTFDNDGYLWIFQGSKLYQLNTAAQNYSEHTYPVAGSSGGNTRLAFNPYQRVFYVVLTDVSSVAHLYQFSSWKNLINGLSSWQLLFTLGSPGAALSYEASNDLLFISHYGVGKLYRYAGFPKTLIDTISVDDTTAPDNPQIDYDLDSAYTCFYRTDSSGNAYGYVSAAKNGLNYLIKISYNGAAISIGSGGSIVSNVLVSQFEVINSTTVDVTIYRSLSPPQLADAQGSVQIDYTPA